MRQRDSSAPDCDCDPILDACREDEGSAEVKATARSLEQLRLQLARFNAALGTANGLRLSLGNDATALETRINSVLKVLSQTRRSHGKRTGKHALDGCSGESEFCEAHPYQLMISCGC